MVRVDVGGIFELIARGLVESEAKATAVPLACCCQSFTDPALDVLWKTQERLRPLLKSLGEDVWDASESTVSVATTSIFPSLNRFI